MADRMIEGTFHGRVVKTGNSKCVLIPADIIAEMMLETGDMIVIRITLPKRAEDVRDD